MATYDIIGATYADGAGTGSCEPPRTVLAVEPSAVMIAQRPAGSAPALEASAESIPLADNSADVAMALLTVHHWSDLEAGIGELRRIARQRIVILTFDPDVNRRFWLLEEYLPEAAALDGTRAVAVEQLATLLGGARIETVPVPHDCTDGFRAAFWRRPEAYLDPEVRAGISLFAQTSDDVIQPGLARLSDDLSCGRWHQRHADLLHREALDAGYRLLLADL
ncbi:methyltransferase domain-containing protein [Streptomyces sp. NPDC005435]|uniref:class I SAM-dependent methyltransferase n=1 Tax=Streptomyces sp. NPDC005435 TaxID=3154464 RepID=UPI0034568F22